MKLTPRLVFILIAAIYLSASFVHGPVEPEAIDGVPYYRIGPFVVAPPMVLSGDSPHYLVAVNSLLQDWDFDLKNNYDDAHSGGWDMGVRFQGQPIDRHVDQDSEGRQYGTHSPFFVLLLAAIAAPFAGTQWVAWACIWATMSIGLAGIWIYAGWLRRRGAEDTVAAVSLLLLALATPLLCYCRDIWTEPFILTLWIAMLVSTNLAILASLGFACTLIKYPFAVVPLTMGLIALCRGERTRAVTLIGSSVTALVVAVGTVQWLFQEVDHFSLFHSGRHRGFDLPFDGMVGMLFAPETGLFLFFPFLVWSLARVPRGITVYLPALSFFLVHAGYQDWSGGTGFSARYLVPLLPIMTLAIAETRHKSTFFVIAAFYSLFWGLLGGFFPPLVYDRSPWGVVLHVWENVRLAG
jgi:hypothetical protein